MLRTIGLAACLIASAGLSHAQERSKPTLPNPITRDGSVKVPDRVILLDGDAVGGHLVEGQVYMFCGGKLVEYREMPCGGMPIEDPRNPNNPNPPARFGR